MHTARHPYTVYRCRYSHRVALLRYVMIFGFASAPHAVDPLIAQSSATTPTFAPNGNISSAAKRRCRARGRGKFGCCRRSCCAAVLC